MTGEILFLAHRMPFPPDRGDKIRSHHILKALAELAPVHVATFVDADSDWRHASGLGRLAASVCLVDRTKPVWRAAVEALVRREPVSLAAFRHRQIAQYVEQLLAARPIEAIYVFSGQMGQYVPADFAGRVIVDLVDVDSAKFGAYAAAKVWPLGTIDARESRLLRGEEERLAHRADHTLLVSDAEAELLRSRLADPANAQVTALQNGIDVDIFDPAQVAPEASLAAAPGPHLVFTGQMDYAPNVAAARRVIHFILPAIRQHHPYAQFHVVGRAPTRELRAHDWHHGVRVWGEVADVRPFLAAADVVVAPLDIARGVQNKVLEAMAMARPVVLTPGAATGIGADESRHFAIEESDGAFAARVLSLLANRGAAQAMGEAARQFVVDRRTWRATLAELPALIGRGGPVGRRDAA
ncbi:MAG TPA: TIGR03087 family PEP-CTERM/XrtA system glycosyltransferase [Sphingomonadaceae bacterium]